MKYLRGAALGMLLGAATLGGGTASAANLQVAPVSVDFADGQLTQSITLTNGGAGPATVQLRVFAWSQADGQDRLDQTTDVTAGPPMVVIPAGAEQVVRVMVRKPQVPGTERTFRLLIDEIPVPVPGRINVALRLSLPIFIGGQAAPPPKVVWSVERRAGTLNLVARNEGTRHVRFDGLRMAHGDAASNRFGGYVLPGQAKRWRIDAPALARANRLTLSGTGSQGAFDVSLAPAERR